MKIRIACLWPYEFTAETDFGDRPGAVAYFIQDVSSDDAVAPPTEISRENYLAIVAGTQAESASKIAMALDSDGAVACGEIPSIAQRIDDIAYALTPEASLDESSEPS